MSIRQMKDHGINRRDFIKISSAFGLTGLSQITCGTDKFKENIIYRHLGKTGIEIPVVSMGTGNCNNPNIVKAAYDRGIKLFATAEDYANGNNEKMIGEALKDMSRDSFMVMTGTTGGLSIDYKRGIYKPDTDPKVYLEHVNGCLKRLQVEYIDILSLGYGAKREFVMYEPIIKAVKQFKSEGKAKYIGLATHSFEPEAIMAAADAGIYDVVTVAYNFKKNNLDEINSAIEYATSAGLGVIAMKTMAGAYWDKERTQPINAQAALKWVIQNENIHTIIPDIANFDHLEKDWDVMINPTLTKEEMKDLKLTAEDMSLGLYCQQFGHCLLQCPEDLDIPTLMRSYMYVYGYSNLLLARRTFDLVSTESLPCTDCSRCSVNCTMGFSIREKVLDIARIRDIPEDMIRHI
jgi:predicted aldo/keto reductase-like oxidoreductase